MEGPKGNVQFWNNYLKYFMQMLVIFGWETQQEFRKLEEIPKLKTFLTEVFTHLLIMKYNEDSSLLLLLKFLHNALK